MTDFLIFGLSAPLVAELGIFGIVPFFLNPLLFVCVIFYKNRNKK